jgi:hypothetical protein
MKQTVRDDRAVHRGRFYAVTHILNPHWDIIIIIIIIIVGFLILSRIFFPWSTLRIKWLEMWFINFDARGIDFFLKIIYGTINSRNLNFYSPSDWKLPPSNTIEHWNQPRLLLGVLRTEQIETWAGNRTLMMAREVATILDFLKKKFGVP